MKINNLSDLISMIGVEKVDICFTEYFLNIIHDSNKLKEVKKYLEDNKNINKVQLEDILNNNLDTDDLTF